MSEKEIIDTFKQCEVADFLENDDVITMDWVKDGILDIIEKQQKQIELQKKSYNALNKDFENLERENTSLGNEMMKYKKEYDLLLNGYNKLVQEHIKAEKVIDQMAQEIFIEYNPHFSTPEQVKEYFYKEVKND